MLKLTIASFNLVFGDQEIYRIARDFFEVKPCFFNCTSSPSGLSWPGNITRSLWRIADFYLPSCKHPERLEEVADALVFSREG